MSNDRFKVRPNTVHGLIVIIDTLTGKPYKKVKTVGAAARWLIQNQEKLEEEIQLEVKNTD